jgi:hypothetical protein
MLRVFLEGSRRFRSIREKSDWLLFKLVSTRYASRARIAQSATTGEWIAKFLLAEVWRLPLLVALAAILLCLDGVGHAIGALLKAHHISVPGIQARSADALLAAMFSALVLVLGLYFAGFTSVASAAYARVQGDVRELILKEFVSNAFLRLSSGAAALIGMILVATVFGIRAGYVTLGASAIVTILVIESFVTVGVRSFRLFDPNYLVPALREDISKAILGATRGHFGFSNASIQNAYMETAERDLSTFQHMVELSTGLPSTMSALASFGLKTFIYYESLKFRIPVESYWFKRKYVHKDWLLADEAQLGVALAASVALRPDEQPDHSWFERRISVSLSGAMRKIHEQGEPVFIATFDRKLTEATGLSANAYAVPEALELARLLSPGFVDFIGRHLGSEEKNLRLVSIDVADTIAAMPLWATLGLGNRLDLLTPGVFEEVCSTAMRDREQDVLLPISTLRALDQVREAWRFERRTEGRVVTPLAHASEVLSRDVLSAAWKAVNALLEHLESDVRISGEQISKVDAVAACALWSRLTEGSEKMNLLLNRFAATEQRLRPHTQTIEAAWPSFDVDALRRRCLNLRRLAVSQMANAATSIPREGWSNDIPDLLGQAYHLVCFDAFEALQRKDKGYFNRLSPYIVVLGSMAIARTNVTLRDGNWQLGCGQIAADMVDLAGYAIIYCELNAGDYWQPMRKAFDESEAARPGFFETLALLAHHAENILAITNRGVLRVGWEQAFEERLKDERLLQRSHYYPNYLFEPPLIVRRNETVRALCSGGSLEGSPFDVFVVKYALRRNAEMGVSGFRSVGDFLNSLERARRSSASAEQRRLKRWRLGQGDA